MARVDVHLRWMPTCVKVCKRVLFGRLDWHVVRAFAQGAVFLAFWENHVLLSEVVSTKGVHCIEFCMVSSSLQAHSLWRQLGVSLELVDWRCCYAGEHVFVLDMNAPLIGQWHEVSAKSWDCCWWMGRGIMRRRLTGSKEGAHVLVQCLTDLLSTVSPVFMTFFFDLFLLARLLLTFKKGNEDKTFGLKHRNNKQHTVWGAVVVATSCLMCVNDMTLWDTLAAI